MLPLTGERTVPGLPAENYWFRRHEAAYAFVRPWVRGRVLAEVGCGEGYGTDLLAAHATRTVGLDYDAVTVAHARRRYPGPAFVRGNLAALPLRTASVDVVASLQVVEHVWDHAQFVGECVRVLRRGGRLVLTTPNRLTFSPGRDAPTNPFHTWEFTAAELTGLLRASGLHVLRLAGLHAGPRLADLDRRHGGSFAEAQLAVPPQRWSPALVRDVASVRTADFTVLDAGAADVDRSLDLVVVATSTGGSPGEQEVSAG